MRGLIAGLLVALAGAATAQDRPPPLEVVVHPAEGARLTSRILLVVDRSGSMQHGEFTRALAAVAMIAEQPADELEVAVIAFAEHAVRWHPSDWCPGQRTDWADLPSGYVAAEVTSWLARQGAKGSTFLWTALERALAEEVDDLTIVIVTDGDLTLADEDQIRFGFEAAQTARLEAGLGQAVVCVYGIGANRACLRWLAEWGGGGYYLERQE